MTAWSSPLPAAVGHVVTVRECPGPDLGGGCRGGWYGAGGAKFGRAFVAVLRAVVVGNGSAEVAVGPLLGELAGLAEHYRHAGEPDLRLGEAFGHHCGSDAVELEHRRPAILDHDRSPGERREIRKQVSQLARGERRDEIGEALAFDRSDDIAVDGDRVVARRQRTPTCGRLLLFELPRVALVGVDDDVEHPPTGTGGRHRHCGSRLFGGAGALPEDHLATSGSGEHELGSVLAGAVEDEVDGGGATHTRADRDAFDHLQVVGPVIGTVAGHLADARPGLANLQSDRIAAERHPDEERQRRRLIGVAGDHELDRHHESASPCSPVARACLSPRRCGCDATPQRRVGRPLSAAASTGMPSQEAWRPRGRGGRRRRPTPGAGCGSMPSRRAWCGRNGRNRFPATRWWAWPHGPSIRSVGSARRTASRRPPPGGARDPPCGR